FTAYPLLGVRAVAQVPRGDQKARHQALEVPLPGAGVRLVEVIDAEQQVALGCGEAAEVHQVAVAADRRDQPHVRRAGQVVGLQQGVATVEGERRHQHTPVA
nr:hypothetical protein [Tanacetum cinerariifolium]